jgi:hypothetical protein
VKNLYLSRKLRHVSRQPCQSSLGQNCRNVAHPAEYFRGVSTTRGLGHFVAARQVTGRPIAITCRERKWNVDENNYSSALHSIAYCLIPGYTIFLNFTMI